MVDFEACFGSLSGVRNKELGLVSAELKGRWALLNIWVVEHSNNIRLNMRGESKIRVMGQTKVTRVEVIDNEISQRSERSSKARE